MDSPEKWKDPPQLAARRSLAQILVQKAGYRFHVEALALLEKNLSADSQSLLDLRIKAHLLARRPFFRDRQKALAVFDQLAELTGLTLSDEIQRVELLKNLNRVSEANQAVKAIVAHSEEDPNVLRFGVKHLLEWGDEKETPRNWFTRLERKVPDEFSTIELKARLLVAEGKSSEAISALEAWIAPQTEDPDLKREITRLEQIVITLTSLAEQQDRLGIPRIADALAAAANRHLAELVRRKPERITWKLRFLTGRWQLDEAWKLVPEAWKSAPPFDVASALVPLLQKSREDQRQYENLRDPLEAALQDEPDSVGLKILAATIAQFCQEYDASIRLYRSALGTESNSITARNELAVLLTLYGTETKATEALELIDGAIEQAGPAHYLLDTKAKVLIALNRPRPAISLLTEAIADTPSSSKYFHLIQAHLLLGQRSEAKRVYRTAVADGFSSDKLHPLERAAANKALGDLKG